MLGAAGELGLIDSVTISANPTPFGKGRKNPLCGPRSKTPGGADDGMHPAARTLVKHKSK
jgi:hypothetical protein